MSNETQGLFSGGLLQVLFLHKEETVAFPFRYETTAMKLPEISNSHNGEDTDSGLLVCDSMQSYMWLPMPPQNVGKPPIRLHGVTTQKTTIDIFKSNFTQCYEMNIVCFILNLNGANIHKTYCL
jgi:hypothetical protein